MSGDVMSPELRKRLEEAAARPLRVRRAILLLAAHAAGHMQHPHGDWCEECREHYPCVAVQRAASPALTAFADCDVSMTDRLDAERGRISEAILNASGVGEFTYREGYLDGLDHAARIARATP